jgi:hypothetical protein
MGKMNYDYIIAVLTRNRVETQFFIESLPILIRRLITIVCHPGERIAHLKRWEGKVANVIEYGDYCTNIGEARDYLMNYCIDNKIQYVIQIDDNVVFAARAKKSNVDFKHKLLTIRNNFTSDEQIALYVNVFEWMLDSLRSGYGVVGVSHRSGNNRKEKEFEENTRLFAVWGISVRKYRRLGVKFADNPYKEDFHMQLAMLTNGIKTICNNCFTFDKLRGANQDGGCSVYRTLSCVNRGSEILKETYPNFVSLVEKKSDNWSNLSETKSSSTIIRKEVIIHWKKAYDCSVKND